MSDWRAELQQLFPTYERKLDAGYSLHEVFFDFEAELDQRIMRNDEQWLDKVFQLVDWCFETGDREIRNAAATAFVEHLADGDERTALISCYIKPAVFEAMWNEFSKRRERSGTGKALALLEAYNARRGTAFMP